MFEECESFNADISNWDMSNAQDITEMFKGCITFNRELNVWEDSFSDIPALLMYGCFDGCNKLKHLPSWYKQ